MNMHRITTIALALALGLVITPALAFAKTPKLADSGGWAQTDQYGQLFNPSQMVTVSGTVQSINTVKPMEGMSEGVMVLVRTDSGQVVPVQLGPSWFITRQGPIVQQGDTISIHGSRAQVNGKPVVIASTLMKGNMALMLRDRRGMPVWQAWRPAHTSAQQQQQMERMHQQEMQRRQQEMQQRQQEMQQRQQQLEQQRQMEREQQQAPPTPTP
ncbi:MAG TPA: hypothetical protein VFG83_16955 [Kofleriaceae bacterium]|nr:hypothetical protein [Kofleriaceae bacterium]